MSEPFVPFSASHLLMLLTLVVLSILLYAFRFPLRTRPKLKRFLRYALAALLAVSQAVLDAWNIAEGAWSAAYTLPLELCSITLLLSVVMLLTRSRVLYGILFFAGIGGALQALVTPNLAFGYPHIRFFQFFCRPYADHFGFAVHDLDRKLQADLEIGGAGDDFPERRRRGRRDAGLPSRRQLHVFDA